MLFSFICLFFEPCLTTSGSFSGITFTGAFGAPCDFGRDPMFPVSIQPIELSSLEGYFKAFWLVLGCVLLLLMLLLFLRKEEALI